MYDVRSVNGARNDLRVAIVSAILAAQALNEVWRRLGNPRFETGVHTFVNSNIGAVSIGYRPTERLTVQCQPVCSPQELANELAQRTPGVKDLGVDEEGTITFVVDPAEFPFGLTVLAIDEAAHNRMVIDFFDGILPRH